MTNHPVFDELKRIARGLDEVLDALWTVVKMPMEALIEAIDRRGGQTADVTLHLADGQTMTRTMPLNRHGVSTEPVTFGPLPEGTITAATVTLPDGTSHTIPIGIYTPPTMPHRFVLPDVPTMEIPADLIPVVEEAMTVCPRCRQWCSCRYEQSDGPPLCGFCAGVGPDGRYTGRPGRLP